MNTDRRMAVLTVITILQGITAGQVGTHEVICSVHARVLRRVIYAVADIRCMEI